MNPIPTIGLTIRLTAELHRKLVAHRKATDEPTNDYVNRLIRDDLAETASPRRRKVAV